jgi:hypothetical protein
MSEVLGETCPFVDFEEQFGDLQVWQQCRHTIDQVLCCLRHRHV